MKKVIKLVSGILKSSIVSCMLIAAVVGLSGTQPAENSSLFTPVIKVNASDSFELLHILNSQKLPNPSSSAYFVFIADKKVYSNSKGYVDPGDKCFIEKIDGNNAYVKYPTPSGYVRRWFTMSKLLPVSLTGSYDVRTASDYIQAFSTNSLKTKFGRVFPNDRCFILSETSSAVYIAMPLTGTKAYQLCWISKANADKYLKSSSSGTATADTVACPVRNYTETNHAGINSTSWGYYSSNSRSDNRHWHLGIDLMVSGDKYSSRTHNEDADKVYALTDGTVKAAGYNSANGNYVVIQHMISGKTVYSFYAHLYDIRVKTNTAVKSNTVIGSIGWTGDSPGNGKHLHFAIADTLVANGGYYGYTNINILEKNVNSTTYQGIRFYNPWYVINYKKLP